MNGYCLGTIDTAAKVSCSDNVGAYIVCQASQGCTDLRANSTPFVVCGDGNGGTGAVTCDGSSDCPANYDCCYEPTGQHCLMQSQPGVVGSGCATFDTNPNGPQASVVCDPLNPNTSCPTGKICQANTGGAQVSFGCQ